MLEGLFVTPAVTSIEEALGSALGPDAEGPLAVLGNPKLAEALAEKRAVIPVGMSPRAVKSLTGKKAPRQLAAPHDDLGTIEPGSLAAVIGVDITLDDGWQATVRTWTRAVRDGGAVVFVDRGRATEASRRALCAGLTELEQRQAGRVVVTSGLVTHL